MDGEISNDALLRSAMRLIKESRDLHATSDEHIAETQAAIAKSRAILKRLDDDLKRYGLK
jgi:hypothetical protein